MPRYEKAAPEVLAMLLSVASEQYPDLARVRFEVVMAWSGSDLLAAEVRRTNPLFRAAGVADALVVIDAERWEKASGPEKVATLDHALASISPVFKGSMLSTDTAGRPRLKRRRPDLFGLGYRQVWERHKSASVEAGSARALKSRAGRLMMFD